MGTKSEIINAQNSFSAWIKDQMEKNNLSRKQIRYILTDKLNDMSKTDIWWEDTSESP